MALNDTSTAHLNQYSDLELLFFENSDPVAMKTAFADRRIQFQSTLKICYSYRDTANTSTKGFTKAKNTAKKVNSKSASAITGKGNSYGIAVNNTQLSTMMTGWSDGFLRHLNDPDFAGVIQKICDTLTPYIATDPAGTAPYFTTVILDAVQSDKDVYVDSLGKYKNTVGIINTAKGSFVTTAIPAMDEHITFMEGFLTDIADKYPDFVTQFKAIVQKLSVIGKRNQGMSAVMTYAIDGKVINTVGEFRITNYPAIKHPKIIHTNTNGIIDLLQLKIGTWDGIFSTPGCIDQPVTVKVTSKKVTAFNIKMAAGTNSVTPQATTVVVPPTEPPVTPPEETPVIPPTV